MRVYAVSRRRRSAQVEVPKNELFIAKLNKATEDADLELIFSRFGRIESCDIVRDWKTGDSLNFAFIAFEEEKSGPASRRVEAPSRHLHESSPGMMEVGGLVFDFGGTTMLTQSFRTGPAWKRIKR
jgi:hypothetical protein